MKPSSKIKANNFVNEAAAPTINLDMVVHSVPEESDNDPFIAELENVLRDMEKEDNKK